MKEIKLLSMCEYIKYLIVLLKSGKITTFEFKELAVKYMVFLQASLELKRFVPIRDSRPLDKPKNYDSYVKGERVKIWHGESCKEYEEALKEVWFTGWIYDQERELIIHRDGVHFSKDFREKNNIEFLVNFKCAYLTPSKSKELGLTTE